LISKEIYKSIKLKRSKKIDSMISNNRHKYRNIINEIQRPSKDNNSEEIIIEETILFGYELESNRVDVLFNRSEKDNNLS